MPEGPETRLAADRVHAAVAGRRADTVRFGLSRLRRFEAELSGRRISDLARQGDADAVRGRARAALAQPVLRALDGLRPPPPAGDRALAARVDRDFAALGAALQRLRDRGALGGRPRGAPVPREARAGPARPRDAASADRAPSPRAPLRATLARRAALDQGFLGGVDNYLRSEVLFFAKLPPERRPADLDDYEVRRLARAAREIARRAYRTKGTTETPEHVAAAKRAGQPRRIWRHAVFYRDGRACRRCGDAVTRDEFGGRRLYRCPTCQGGA